MDDTKPDPKLQFDDTPIDPKDVTADTDSKGDITLQHSGSLATGPNATKGAEGFVGSIETYKPEIAKSPEIQPSIETEIRRTQPEVEVENDPEEKPELEEKTAPMSDPDINVVDKTEELTQLHDIDPRDKITQKADDEEEKFIREVEAAHGRE